MSAVRIFHDSQELTWAWAVAFVGIDLMNLVVHPNLKNNKIHTLFCFSGWSLTSGTGGNSFYQGQCVPW